MILSHFNLREQPFGVTPDPRFWYASDTHREAFASMIYGLESERGFVALIAKPGMGKTTLIRQGLERIQSKARTVFLFQSIQTPEQLLKAILTDLGVATARASLIELQAKLNNECAKQCASNKGIVVVVDEAQNMPDSVLEFLRTLSNFETSKTKLIQVLLSGQPQLAEKLASPGMVQLRQRISVLSSLKPLSPSETRTYVEHRLKVAGYASSTPLFTQGALNLIATYSQGIPRNISNLCFNALSLGCAMKRKSIDIDIVREVVSDLNLEPLSESTTPATQLVAHEDFTRRSSTESKTIELATAPPAIFEVDPDPAIEGSSGVPAVDERWVSPLFASVPEDRFIPPKVRWGLRTAAICLSMVLILVGITHGFVGFWQGIHVLAANAQGSLRSTDHADPVAQSQRVQYQPAPNVEQVHLFSAREGQSLRSVCVENFGKCTPQIMREIHHLNPLLAHRAYIGAGQLIRIPDNSILTSALDQAGQNSSKGRTNP